LNSSYSKLFDKTGAKPLEYCLCFDEKAAFPQFENSMEQTSSREDSTLISLVPAAPPKEAQRTQRP